MNTDDAGARPRAFPTLIRVLLGLLFLVSALLKVLDFSAFAEQVSYYGIVQEDTSLQVVAGATIALEVILGAALLAGWHARFVLAVTALVLVVFTGLIAYAWAFNDLEECGCFGSFLAVSPAMSIAKNVVLLLLLPFAWPRTAVQPQLYQALPPKQHVRIRGFVAGCVVGIVLALVLEIAGFAIYAKFFHDHMIGNLEAKMLVPSPPGTPISFDWQALDREGNPVDMAVFKDKPLFVAFFSPSCVKCEAQLPSLQRFYTALDGTGIGFAAFSTREPEKVDAVLKRQGCTFSVYSLGEQRPPLFQQVQVPSAYLFSKDGTLVYEQFDAARWDDPAFVAFVKGLASP